MKDNNNKLFGGMGPEKAGELGGSAHHKCRGRECDEKNHATNDKDHNKSAATHKTGLEHGKNANADHSQDKHGHAAKTEHKANKQS